MSQLAINRLRLPTEIIVIIKNFALLSIERQKLMAIQKQLFYIIKYFKTGNIYYYNPTIKFKEISRFHNTFKHIDKRFCETCGNYKYTFICACELNL